MIFIIMVLYLHLNSYIEYLFVYIFLFHLYFYSLIFKLICILFVVKKLLNMVLYLFSLFLLH